MERRGAWGSFQSKYDYYDGKSFATLKSKVFDQCGILKSPVLS